VNKRTPEAEKTLLMALGMGMGFESAAPLAGVIVQTVRNWRKADEDFEQRCQEAIAKGKLRVVGKLMEQINNGHHGAITFWLKTRMEEFQERKDDGATASAEDIGAAIRAFVSSARQQDTAEGDTGAGNP